MSSDVDCAHSTADPVAAVVPSHSLVLPVEVCERIIDFFAHDAWVLGDPSMLHPCALVCTHWLPRSRIHLYFYVSLRTERDFFQFLHTVQTNTLLGTFVRLLSLGELNNDSSPQGLEEGEDIPTAGVGSPLPRPRHTANWILHIPLRLLPLLPTLSTIEMWCLPTFNGTTQMFLSKFRSCRTVTQLDLAGGHLPSLQDLLRLLSYFPSLENCSLSRVAIVNTSSTVVADRYLRTLPAPQAFEMWDISDAILMDGLATLPILSHVKRLRYLCNHGAMVRGLEQVLLHCSPMIVGVEIMLLEEGGHFSHAPDALVQTILPERIDLSLASNLWDVQICIRLIKGAENWLGTLSLPTSIKYIDLALLLCADSLALVLSQPWATFDGYLSGPDFTRLGRVRLKIHERELSEKDRGDLRLAMNDILPKLRKRHVLDLGYLTHDLNDYDALFR